MKKLIFTILAASLIGSFAPSANAQMMGRLSNMTVDWNEVVEHTAREEQEGEELWDKLQAKEVVCGNFNDKQFGTLGEYFMGQMAGDSHAAMNAMMIRMMGEEGEEQMHIILGKQMSGCDPNTLPSEGVVSNSMMLMMMMNMIMGGGMMGGQLSPFSNNLPNNMMNFGFGSFGSFGWIFMILWWVLIILGLVALIKWLTRESRGTRNHEKSALDILKERYARGEINKKEFEEKKNDLV